MKYAIATTLEKEKEKNVFIKITKIETDVVYGIIQDIQTETKEALRFSKNDISAWFDKRPKYGKVYGINTTVLFSREKIKGLGILLNCRKLSESEQKQFKNLWTWALELIKKYDKLSAKFPAAICIMPNSGKTQGYWQEKGYKPNECGLLTLSPQAIDKDLLRHTIAHEIGHPMWSELSQKTKTKWILAFYKNIELTKFIKDKVVAFKDDLISAGGCRNLIKSFDDESDDIVLFKQVIAYISKIYRLSVNDIDNLIAAGNDLSIIWPTTALNTSKVIPQTTEYSTKNPEEFFCEAFALYNTDVKIPKSLQKLIKKL